MSYSINAEFQQASLQLATELDLDEVEAAKILLAVQNTTYTSERSIITEATIRFHQRRKSLLDCLGLIFHIAAELNIDEGVQDWFNAFVVSIVGSPNGNANFARRCLLAMENIESWLKRLAEKLNSASVLGQPRQSDQLEVVEYQRVSLVKQHESLGAIILYLVKGNHATVADFEYILAKLKKTDKYDQLLGKCLAGHRAHLLPSLLESDSPLVHYIPGLSASITRFGGTDGSSDLEEAKRLNEKFFADDHTHWNLVYLHAAVRAWWLAEYSSFFGEAHNGGLTEGQLDAGQCFFQFHLRTESMWLTFVSRK